MNNSTDQLDIERWEIPNILETLFEEAGYEILEEYFKKKEHNSRFEIFINNGDRVYEYKQ